MNKKPLVRIGMIHSAEEIRFTCDGPFILTDISGSKKLEGLGGKEYVVQINQAYPSQMRYRVRLAIAEQETEAEQMREKLAARGFAISLWHPGVILQIDGRTIDNREFWLVSDPFASHEEAWKFAEDYEPVGEAVVVKEIIQRAHGRLQCEGEIFEQAIRIVRQEEHTPIKLHNVTVGIEFHWQHQRTQLLPGILEIGLNNDGKLVAINELDIETYLISVNSSEMSKDNPLELLKAQTIAARSTILATMGKHHYDENFHLCADDHCQCYHGIANISEASREAVNQTTGEALMYDNRVCDARYAKICGGIMEDYRYVWDDRSVPYLVAGIDGKENLEYPLTDETKVKAYIDSSPDVWCNTDKYQITSNLPYNTRELFRWKVTYSREQLELLLKKRLHQDFGSLIDIIPGERGHSGRLIYLDIIGSKKSLRIGKELKIRRALSESHLYSACFYIERDRDHTGAVSQFHLIGAGWGHGVGLCQVGATVMAQEGYNYKEILAHYYKNSQLIKLYQ